MYQSVSEQDDKSGCSTNPLHSREIAAYPFALYRARCGSEVDGGGAFLLVAGVVNFRCVVALLPLSGGLRGAPVALRFIVEITAPRYQAKFV